MEALDDPETPIGKVQRFTVSKYDGQTICVAPRGDALYEIGNYLGGGAAGVVYEAIKLPTKQRVAIKIINPTSFRLMPSTALQRCVVACRGAPIDASSSSGKVRVRRGGAASCAPGQSFPHGSPSPWAQN